MVHKLGRPPARNNHGLRNLPRAPLPELVSSARTRHRVKHLQYRPQGVNEPMMLMELTNETSKPDTLAEDKNTPSTLVFGQSRQEHKFLPDVPVTSGQGDVLDLHSLWSHMKGKLTGYHSKLTILW